MIQRVINFIKRSKLLVVGLVIAVAVGTAGTVSLLQAQPASAAASCDTVNIIDCGLDASTLGGYIVSLQSFYNKGTDNGNNDLKAVYQWAGATDANIKGMNADNTKLGTLYKNGDVQVNGTVVGTDAWVSARFNDGAGFTHVEGNVYARKTTTSFAEASAPVIVHYDANGEVDFVVMVDCGNAVKVTPVKPAAPKPTPTPQPALTCNLLTATATSALRTYTFTAKASVANATITSYVFNFGDGKSTTVTTSNTTASTTYAYPADSTTYNASVAVYSNYQYNVTSAACATKVTTLAPVVVPAVVCSSLVYTEVPGQNLTYKFVARATATKSTILNYVYYFGDNTTGTVTTNATSSSAEHTYADNGTTYVAYVVVNSTTQSGVTSNTCKVNVTTPQVTECQPGVPTGSPACNDCKPGVPLGSAACTAAPIVTPTTPTTPTTTAVTPVAATTTLPDTGPADLFGIFTAAVVIGTIGHRFLMRRRLTA